MTLVLIFFLGVFSFPIVVIGAILAIGTCKNVARSIIKLIKKPISHNKIDLETEIEDLRKYITKLESSYDCMAGSLKASEYDNQNLRERLKTAEIK